MTSGGDHLLFNEWGWEEEQYDENSDICDQCDGSGFYWIQENDKWRKQRCICSEPQI